MKGYPWLEPEGSRMTPIRVGAQGSMMKSNSLPLIYYYATMRVSPLKRLSNGLRRTSALIVAPNKDSAVLTMLDTTNSGLIS
jgi:hypothetical protein